MQQADVVIAGAGIVGLSLALTLSRSGRSVTLLERQMPGRGASRAAAGMLAVHDPGNPPELLALAERSAALYPQYLCEIERLGGEPVPFETQWTLERSRGPVVDAATSSAASLLPALSLEEECFQLHRERSLDPRRLFASLLAAVRRSGSTLLPGIEVGLAREQQSMARLSTADGKVIVCNDFVDCTGAWSATYARPVKGQMLRLQLPPGALEIPGRGNVVVRTPEVYLVPRLDGSCLVGATVEDAGFDIEVHPAAAAWLRHRACELLPALADAPELESWCGLRPGTATGLPVLGAVAEHIFIANGLYRNGILLAPVVAEALSSMILHKESELDLSAFEPALQTGGERPAELLSQRSGR